MFQTFSVEFDDHLLASHVALFSWYRDVIVSLVTLTAFEIV
ncbi:hypothetical protein SynPROS91_01141 [Synechococcus sp. PROS-9-1]|nr:hypothetical protein SynPROS91_01141 [Synechococcus sp. PROS-9-1]